ncbi:MAG: Calx-beta domain-containing protein, partial [Gaiellaceae bacterium]
GSKTVKLSLSSPSSGAVLGTQKTATLTILDNDRAFAFSAATYSVNESGGHATITIKRSGSSSGAYSVHFATANGTATAGSDYTAVSQTVSFAAGVTSKTVSIPIKNDTVKEPNETVKLSLSSPSSGAVLGTQKTATLTIIDND